MFSSALKSFQSNISANYTISSSPSSIAGAWKVYDGKKKSTGKAVSIFVFDRKTLEPHSGGLSRGSGGSSLRKLHDEVVARIKKEANLLARLRHPSILELAEPIEDTRSGGLMFATEPVTASLAGLLQDKDDQERAGGQAGRRGRFVVEDADGQQRRKEFEIDELEIQKGLLQVAQGLEFLHESAGLVHGNLTPEAIFVNVKSDWKIAGFAFAGPPDESIAQSTMPPLSLSEAMYHEPRLPKSIQLDLDYTSPDFAMDSNVSTSADMFSLGLVLISLYNSPHLSPIKSNSNLSSYKKLFSSSSTTPSSSNNFLSSRPLPNDLKSAVLPRLITRRPAQRMNAREFQQSAFFDNILVSSIRFLDALPAKTPNEKSQFMRGLPKILDQFPKSVLDKKVLPALLEETKDRSLLSLILQNVFKVIKILPSGQRAVSDKILPQLRDIFAASTNSKTAAAAAERDTAREAGLVVVLENVALIGANCTGKEFKDFMLPIIILGLDSPTHAIVDKALGCLPTILSILDFSSIKNELFPTVAAVFSKTSSLGIKVRGLEAFVILCGGTSEDSTDIGNDLDGMASDRAKKSKSVPASAVLDKYTIQEKIVPLLKAMKTKEPAVMMAALSVFKQVGKIADAEFLAMEALPILWSFSLGPLLNVQQFQAFMDLIKSISSRIEQEQMRKLREINTTSSRSMDINARSQGNDLMSMGGGASTNGGFGGGITSDDPGEMDFESLVLGKRGGGAAAASPNGDFLGDPLSSQPSLQPQQPPPPPQQQQRPAFPFQHPSQPQQQPSLSTILTPQSRTITPDHTSSSLRNLAPLNPSSSTSGPMMNGISSFAPMQPSKPTSFNHNTGPAPAWPTIPAAPTQQQTQRLGSSFGGFNIAPPPPSTGGGLTNGGMVGSGGLTNAAMQRPGMGMGMGKAQGQGQGGKSGLDKWESLL
ncbi:MAG: Protein kinase domain-containing protein ppk32 [Ramalina farinacea]|uniref:Protein kinase domain-containing protein ppk32 n=1 Tax=Ramalina farinacea TaxID=258253 RepID=A0AA43QSS4_9LECA|nr:Protein kinase domain-containing protein ppk32 [Ramalina farinacea]